MQGRKREESDEQRAREIYTRSRTMSMNLSSRAVYVAFDKKATQQRQRAVGRKKRETEDVLIGPNNKL